MSIAIYIDADACTVKDEAYRVARRYGLKVYVVSNSGMRTPAGEWCEMVLLTGFGEVDDWIAAQSGPTDIVVTSDIPLAERCLKNGSRVLSPKGYAWTNDTIGQALASRALHEELRQTGVLAGGPSAMTKQDRGRFLSRLDETVHAIRKGK